MKYGQCISTRYTGYHRYFVFNSLWLQISQPFVPFGWAPKNVPIWMPTAGKTSWRVSQPTAQQFTPVKYLYICQWVDCVFYWSWWCVVRFLFVIFFVFVLLGACFNVWFYSNFTVWLLTYLYRRKHTQHTQETWKKRKEEQNAISPRRIVHGYTIHGYTSINNYYCIFAYFFNLKNWNHTMELHKIILILLVTCYIHVQGVQK